MVRVIEEIGCVFARKPTVLSGACLVDVATPAPEEIFEHRRGHLFPHTDVELFMNSTQRDFVVFSHLRLDFEDLGTSSKFKTFAISRKWTGNGSGTGRPLVGL